RDEGGDRVASAVWMCAVAIAGMAAGFLAGTPFAIVDLDSFLRDLSSISAHLAGGHGVDLGRGWTSHFSISLRYGLGVPMLAAAIAGAVWLMRARPALAIFTLSFPLSYYAVIGSGRTVFLRYIDPVLPFGCLLAAVAIAALAQAAAGAGRRWGTVTAAALTLVVAWPSVQRSIALDRML